MCRLHTSYTPKAESQDSIHLEQKEANEVERSTISEDSPRTFPLRRSRPRRVREFSREEVPQYQPEDSALVRALETKTLNLRIEVNSSLSSSPKDEDIDSNTPRR